MALPACVSQNILSSLRESTRPAHEALENKLDWQSICSEHGAYEQVLARFYGFVLPWESKAHEFIKNTPLVEVFRARRKAHLLEQDLRHFGWTPDRIAVIATTASQDLPGVASTPCLLGSAYVLEGSTLGGQIITRIVSDHLSLHNNVGCSYFASYGKRVGPMWKEFCAVLESNVVVESDRQAAVASACATFQAIDFWLSGARA